MQSVRSLGSSATPSPLRHVSPVRIIPSLFALLLLLSATGCSAIPATINPTTSIPVLTNSTFDCSSPSWQPQETASRSNPTAAPIALAAVTNPPANDPGPPDYDALVPANPGASPRPTADLAEHGLRQTTYYSCNANAAAQTTHCGWHRPLIEVSAATPARRPFRLWTYAGGDNRGRGFVDVVAFAAGMGWVLWFLA